MNRLSLDTEDYSLASLLELAANNDVSGFKRLIECDPSSIDEVGLWYIRHKESKKMVNEQRTPLMVAATYGSIDVMKLILSLSEVDVNLSCGLDKSTALHCAASGGSENAVDAVKLLLEAGADVNSVDVNGHRPGDVIVFPTKLEHAKKTSLEELLQKTDDWSLLRVITTTTSCNTCSPPLSTSPEIEIEIEIESPCSARDSKMKSDEVTEKKEYPSTPSLPDIKNSIYSTDEFRMYSFKVRPCSRAYSHDWTECPFVHPGENARRRDPRKFHYSCVPCPEFRKGSCRRGDLCEYAHGVFECWLHPAQYRTRLCKDGTNCARRVCFFAHTNQELRPLYVSTGSAVPSPRSSASSAMDFVAAMTMLPPSPSSMPVMSPSPFTPPMSPSGASVAWPQPNIPALHLPGSNFQSSRLRSSLNARDISMDDFDLLLPDYDQHQQQQQFLNELSCLSPHAMNSNTMNRSGRMKPLTPSNLDDLFSAESSSPRYADPALASAVFSPTHKSTVFNQFQQHQQSLLAPVNTNFASKNVEHPLLQASLGMSPRNVEPISPMGSRISMLAQREKQQFRSLSFRELGSNSAAAAAAASANSWSKWGSPTGNFDWPVGAADEVGKLRRSSSFELGNNGEEPDLSWVQSLVKESPADVKGKFATTVSNVAAAAAAAGSSSEGSNMSTQMESVVDHAVLGAWLEQMQLDHLVAQQN